MKGNKYFTALYFKFIFLYFYDFSRSMNFNLGMLVVMARSMRKILEIICGLFQCGKLYFMSIFIMQTQSLATPT